MAKRQNEGDASRPPARVRYFELEGSDETIQKALATFERMRNPVSLPPPTPKRLAAPSGSPTEPSLFDDQQEVVDAEVSDESDDAPEPGTSSQRRKRGEGPKVDRNAGIAPVANLDFIPQGKKALKAFVVEKAPKSDVDRVLVLSHYLHHTMGLTTFSPGHILTAFRHVGVEVPVDLPATIRNMKKRVLLNFTDSNVITMATEGNNRVEHQLPKAPK